MILITFGIIIVKFTPCKSECTRSGDHCNGCGRSLEEITEIKQLVNNMVRFVAKMNYENPDDFINAITKSLQKKLIR